jgi:ribosomal protein L34E
MWHDTFVVGDARFECPADPGRAHRRRCIGLVVVCAKCGHYFHAIERERGRTTEERTANYALERAVRKANEAAPMPEDFLPF